MNIGVITNVIFSKNWTSEQGYFSIQRSMQPIRTPQGDYYPRSKHSYRDKEIIGTMPESKRSVGSNKKGDAVNFGHKHPLKTSWLQGLLPDVKRGLYGDILTKQNVSLDHLRPVSKGGKTELSNLALASKEKNSLRGSRDLKEVLTRQQAMEYIKQFAAYKEFRSYIVDILRTFEHLGVIR